MLSLHDALPISAKSLAKKIHISSFAFSFFVLGILTSIPEMAVGLNAISQNRPEIFVGNLLGSIIILFLVIIPLLALVNGRSEDHTSELPSLMRTSYAVFCLKKKT